VPVKAYDPFRFGESANEVAAQTKLTIETRKLPCVSFFFPKTLLSKILPTWRKDVDIMVAIRQAKSRFFDV
jgi:hypothetical protein